MWFCNTCIFSLIADQHFILVSQVNSHICGSIALFSISFSLAFGMSIEAFVDQVLGGVVSGNTYCWIFYNSMTLNYFYTGFDGIGTSFFRLLYIKKGTWIKYKFGEFRLLLMVGLLVCLVTGIEIYWFTAENISSRSMYNTCFGHSNHFQVNK